VFSCRGCAALRAYLTPHKSAGDITDAVLDLHAWLGRYGKTCYVLTTDSGSAEMSTEFKRALGTYPLSIDNSAPAAPEHQEANPIERQMQPIVQMWLILINSTNNLGERAWGLAFLATIYHMNNTVGYLARIAGEGK
jgi:hypothetical protein